MDRHIWTDKKGLIRVINRALIAGYADETQSTQEEVLRLAQREADLERRVCDLRVRELDLGTEVTRLNRRITEQVHQLADSESRGRQYCVELAEMAGRIRELEEERDGLAMTAEESDEIQAELAGALAIGFGEDLKPCIAPCPGHLGPKARTAVVRAARAWREMEREAAHGRALVDILAGHCGERGDSESAAETLARIIRERDVAEELAADRLAYIADFEPQAIATGAQNERLRTAIADGVAHIEKARALIVPLGRQDDYVVEQLDLAHEVLSKSSQPLAPVPATGAPLPSATAPTGWRPAPITCEMWQRVHASMLADHADRLKALEGRFDLLESWGSEHDWHRDPCDRSMPVFPFPRKG